MLKKLEESFTYSNPIGCHMSVVIMLLWGVQDKLEIRSMGALTKTKKGGKEPREFTHR